jgi:hypothetical protein
MSGSFFGTKRQFRFLQNKVLMKHATRKRRPLQKLYGVTSEDGILHSRRRKKTQWC